MKLWLVRHAQPEVQSGLCYGSSDVRCAADVLEKAAQQLLEHLPKNVQVICSPLQRCEQLAQVLCRLEPDFSYKTDEKLAEMHFGAWEMRAWDAIPQSELTAWTDDFAAYRCGGHGESAGQFVQRVVERLWQSTKRDQDEIWITHAGVIRALLWLERQPSFKAWVQALLAPHPAAMPWPDDLLNGLRAADWPKDALAFGQIRTWVWPHRSARPSE